MSSQSSLLASRVEGAWDLGTSSTPLERVVSLILLILLTRDVGNQAWRSSRCPAVANGRAFGASASLARRLDAEIPLHVVRRSRRRLTRSSTSSTTSVRSARTRPYPRVTSRFLASVRRSRSMSFRNSSTSCAERCRLVAPRPVTESELKKYYGCGR